MEAKHRFNCEENKTSFILLFYFSIASGILTFGLTLKGGGGHPFKKDGGQLNYKNSERSDR